MNFILKSIILALLTFTWELQVLSQVVTNSATYSCLSGHNNVASDLTACDYLTTAYLSCNTLSGMPLSSCICIPQVFTAIFDCENEERVCLQSYEEDNEAQQVLANWHAGCDDFITFTPITPALSTLVSSVAPLAVCSNIESICEEGGLITSACKSSFSAITQGSQLTSCICQSSLLSAASVCEFDGNITCLEETATLSNIDLWRLCPSQAASFAQSNAQQTSGSLSSQTIETAPLSPAPSPTTQTIASSTSKSAATTLHNTRVSLGQLLTVLLSAHWLGNGLTYTF